MVNCDKNITPVFLLAVCLLFETVAFVCVTVIQFKWSRELRTRLDESQANLTLLQTRCLDTAIRYDLETLFQSLDSKAEDKRNRHGSRQKRQSNTGLLQHMMLDMLKAEENILLSHCQNNSKLCVPGPKGDMGPKGDQGLPGNLGPPGVNGTDGPPGLSGLAGVAGAKGDQDQNIDCGSFKPHFLYPATRSGDGAKGEPGSIGLSGQQGPVGPKGEPGSPGMKGDPGITGPAGQKGEKGQKGSDGQKGQPGQPGLDGEKGEKGIAGTAGLKGEPGPQGPAGAPGVELQKNCMCVKTPKVDILPKKTEYHFGDNINISCIATGDPIPTVTWTKVTNDVCTRMVPSPNLFISSLSPSALGTWKCEARNQFGSTTKQITIASNDTRPVDCDFEKGGTCLWRNDLSDQSQWTMNSGPTITSGTGPDFDHTFSSPAGHYIYMEGSIGSPGDVANLLSPELPPAQESCISFWFNMHGQNIGNLSLLSKDCNDKTKSLIDLSGDQGSQWQQAIVTVPAVTTPHSFVLRAVLGNGVLSDIAIDDIEYYAGKCKSTLQLPGPHDVSVAVNANSRLVLPCQGSGNPPPVISWSKVDGCGNYDNYTGNQYTVNQVTFGDAGTYVCTLSNGPGSRISKTFHVTVNGSSYTDSCDFSTQFGLCTYRQDNSDKLDWISHTGETPSLETGPSNDHTLGTASGTYLYIEASSPSQQGDNAILRSHVMPANQSACFSFFYNMHGVDTGHLRVYIEDSCTHTRQMLFNKSGDQGTAWFPAEVRIPARQVPRDYFILIEADVGPSYHSDIAIDDLHIKDDTCVVQSNGKRHVESASDLACDFEIDYCTWTQSAVDDFDWTRQTGSTQSAGTGPDGDHTAPNGNGHYIYIEASGEATGAKADLISKLLPPGKEFCLQFALNMYGTDMGAIDIIIKPQTNTQFLLNHFAQSSSASLWIEKKVNIPAQAHSFNIIIEGVRGNGFSSDAAVDDIMIRPGACT